MRVSVSPVNFKNKNGAMLYGMLHSPEKPRTNIAIIILSPGIKNRVAPHRLYVKMARSFSELGFPVLRFDPEGLGDSEGEIDERYAADLYGTIQVGRFVEDTICAMDWMQRDHNIFRFVLTGLCGGAITGLLAGAKDKRVECLMGQSIPIILDSSNIVYDEFLTDSELKKRGEGYLGKLFDIKSWHSWIRFLTFRSDYRLIYRSVLQPTNAIVQTIIRILFSPKHSKVWFHPAEIFFSYLLRLTGFIGNLKKISGNSTNDISLNIMIR